MTELGRALELLRELIDTHSTTGEEAGVAAILERELSADGYTVGRQQVADGRDNLLAVRAGETPRLLFSTHIDTVPPFLEFRREGDVIYGRGACDTKGGIVALLEAGRELRREGRSGFGYLFVVGEEVDHSGAKAVERELDLKVRDIILCEPTVCRLINAQKGVVKVRLIAEGKAAHSGYPHLGVSAVERLLTTIETLRRHEWPTHDVLGSTFFNIGLIGGGVAANVLAPHATAELMFRTVGPSADILEVIDAALVEGVRHELLTENGPELFDVPDGFETGVANFNTDASFLKSMGRVLLVGPGDITVAHSAHEHITIEQIERGIALYVKLASELLDRA